MPHFAARPGGGRRALALKRRSPLSKRIVQIEKKGRDAQQAAKVLAKAMRQAHLLTINAAEASTLTGLPLDRCEEALMHLARAYPARLRVGEAGTITFTFARLHQQAPPRGFKAWRAAITRNRQRLVGLGTLTLAPVFLFSVAYNAFILPSGAFFELYEWNWAASVSVTIGLAAALFALALLMFKPWIGLPILAAFSFTFGTNPLFETAILAFFGFAYSLTLKRLLKHEIGGDAAHWLRVIERWARGWIYGPAPADALEDERRLTALILEREQVLSVRDLMLLFDWDKEEAESQLPRLLVDYGGELVMSEEGALVLRFDALEADPARFGRRIDTRPAFDRLGVPRFWDKCPPGLGVFLLATIAFLLWGMAAHPWFSLLPGPWTWMGLAEKDVFLPVLQGLGAWPYVLVLAPQALRLPDWLGQVVAHMRGEGRRKLLRLLEQGADGGPVHRPDTRALSRLGGEIDVARSESGTPWVCFPLLAAGEREAEALRREVGEPRREEAVVYDTAEKGGAH